MLKTKLNSQISDCQSSIERQEINNDWYGSLAWYPFYPLSRTTFFYPYELSYIYPHHMVNNTISDCSLDSHRSASMTSTEQSNSEDITTNYSLGDSSLDFRTYQLTQYPFCGPIITACGTISFQLHHYIRVDITVDKAIRLINFPGRCVAALDLTGNNSCIIHPTGKILQEGITVNIQTGSRLAKMSQRGITFTSVEHSLVYLVDASGTKSTVEHFQDLSYDFSLDVFYTNAICGEEAVNDCCFTITNSLHRYNRNYEEMWIIAGVCIQQNLLGDVRISRDYGRRTLYTSPTSGTMSVSTPFIKMAAGCDPERYFFIKRGEKRLTSHIKSFRVRNGTQKAGFNNMGRLVLG